MEVSSITRLAFLKQVAGNDIADIMCNYFDQNMALYSLISNRLEEMTINKSIDHESKVITFSIIVDGDIESLVNLNNQRIEYYGRLFIITLNRTANILNISIKEEAVG